MKQILCYGDSNTYGFNPKSGSRFADDKRWTSLLATQLKGKCEIIEEGLKVNRIYDSGYSKTHFIQINLLLLIFYLILY